MKLRSMQYRGILDMTPETRKSQLADGSTSNRILGSVSIRCKAGNSDSKVLDFYVMDAPVNLLSRYAIEGLWPKMFPKFRKVASNSTVTEVPEVVSKSSNMAPVSLKRTIFGCH